MYSLPINICLKTIVFARLNEHLHRFQSISDFFCITIFNKLKLKNLFTLKKINNSQRSEKSDKKFDKKGKNNDLFDGTENSQDLVNY